MLLLGWRIWNELMVCLVGVYLCKITLLTLHTSFDERDPVSIFGYIRILKYQRTVKISLSLMMGDDGELIFLSSKNEEGEEGLGRNNEK